MSIRQPIPEEFHEEMDRVIRAARRRMLVEQPRAPRRRPTWRDVDRVCLPGWLLSRPFQAIANLLYRPGPEIGRLLERLGDRIDGIDEPRRPARLLRSAVHWLLSAPNDAPPAVGRVPYSGMSTPIERALRDRRVCLMQAHGSGDVSAYCVRCGQTVNVALPEVCPARAPTRGKSHGGTQ